MVARGESRDDRFMTTNTPPTSPDDLGAPALLFVPLAGVLAVVAAVWLLASAPGTLALIFAILVALAGMGSVMAVVNRDLNDVDGAGPAASDDEPPS
jgi:hypothetical protein